jgi:biopolymer transport protein ExbB
MGNVTSLGFGHFLQQSDYLAKVLLGILATMSIMSWYLTLYKGLSQAVLRQRSRAFLDFFWSADSLDAVQHRLNEHAAQDPFGHLAAQALKARAHYGAARSLVADLESSEQEFLTQAIRKALDEETMSLERGLTLLATIGATAPFVGLFGTVWGVYHALVSIGLSGSGMLDKVAGPVGEALIMTGIGLAVALPAVVAYNWLSRSNRVLLAELDAFAFELLTFVSTGRALRQPTPSEP